jgi:hypothetical protein
MPSRKPVLTVLCGDLCPRRCAAERSTPTARSARGLSPLNHAPETVRPSDSGSSAHADALDTHCTRNPAHTPQLGGDRFTAVGFGEVDAQERAERVVRRYLDEEQELDQS